MDQARVDHDDRWPPDDEDDSDDAAEVEEERQSMAARVDVMIHRLFTLDVLQIFNVADAEIPRLSQAIRNENAVVKHLHLSLGRISLQTGQALRDALRDNTSIETLTLQIMLFNEHHSLLLEGAGASASITSLHLWNEFDANALVGCLRSSTSIERLSINNQAPLRFDQVVILASAFSGASLGRIRELRIPGRHVSQLDSAGAVLIAEMLGLNDTLQVLDLSKNDGIGDTGAVALAAALLTNTSLKELNINQCRIGMLTKTGALAIAELIKTRNNLDCLRLNQNFLFNYIDPTTEQVLADALWYNTGLTTMEMGFCQPLLGQEVRCSLEINRFRKTYLERDRSRLSPYLYPYVFARVAAKPRVLFLTLQETRESFIHHLPDPSGLWSPKRKRRLPGEE
jgi:hypothetical protein